MDVIRRHLATILVLLAVAASPCCMYADRHHTAPLSGDIYIQDGSFCEGLGKGEIEKKVKRIISSIRDDKYYPELDVFDPDDETIFPRDLASHTFIWEDQYLHSTDWLITITFEGNNHTICVLTDKNRWNPKRDLWEIIKENSLEKRAYLTIFGVNTKKAYEITTRGMVSISTSKDEVGAPILYQQMPLPFALAKKRPELNRWLLGDVSSYEEPPVVMQNVPICANCHSFSRDGKVFGIDMDYGGDKGAYALTEVNKNISISRNDFITWNDFQRSENPSSMGLFSKISPDGRYVISTVKETSFFAMMPDLDFSQLFFPIRGLIAFYSRDEEKFYPLPGADDPSYVQTSPAWSPDGRYVVFSRARVNKELLDVIGEKGYLEIGPDIRISDLNKKYQIQFDIYKIPFDKGKGGAPKPFIGGSNNGKSNYFPRFSPDGKWIVFNQSKTGLVLQPDSHLYIVPAEGGIARRLKCNTAIMNSWHSWSPNSRWLVFSSKIISPYTQLFLTHIDENGNDSPPVFLSRFYSEKFAAVAPEFVNIKQAAIRNIALVD